MTNETLFGTLCAHLRRDEREMRDSGSAYAEDIVAGLIGRRGELVHTWWEVLIQLGQLPADDPEAIRLRGEADTLRTVLVRMVERYAARRPSAT